MKARHHGVDVLWAPFRLKAVRFATVLVLLLPGCTDAPLRTDCTGDGCSAGDPLSRIGYPDATPKVAQFEGCEGGIGLAIVPMGQAQAVVPDEFEIAYGFGGIPNVAGVHTRTFTCSRVVVNTTIFENVSWSHTAVFASPKNESWRGEGINRYVLDTWFSAPELAEWFQIAHVPAEFATFTRERLPPGPSARIDRWTMDGAACGVSVEYNVSGQTLPPSDDIFYHWTGPKPYQRIQLFEAWTMDAHHVSASPFMIEGNCPSQRALENIPAQGTQYQPRNNSTITITGEMFG